MPGYSFSQTRCVLATTQPAFLLVFYLSRFESTLSCCVENDTTEVLPAYLWSNLRLYTLVQTEVDVEAYFPVF